MAKKGSKSETMKYLDSIGEKGVKPKKKKDRYALLQQRTKDLIINKHGLDDELINQPILFIEVATLAADASAMRDYAKEALSMKDAELSAKHRKLAEKGGERATEKLVEQRVGTDPIHIKYVEKLIEAKKYAEQAFAMKEAFQARAYMLRELVSLQVSGYYATAAITNPGRRDSGDTAYKANTQRMSDSRKPLKRKK
tara:strand:- start:910 stop:1500 length:591 start_codon:yes stop_codon:yes gene_type:complete